MVSQAYMLEKPSGPSPIKVWFDQKVIPVVINAAGDVEGLLERVAIGARKAPIASLAAALGVGTLLTLCVVPSRS
ncbi:MAG: hypothetical protein ACRYGI_07860 [Janthinobacterium lividum]